MSAQQYAEQGAREEWYELRKQEVQAQLTTLMSDKEFIERITARFPQFEVLSNRSAATCDSGILKGN